MVDEKHGDSRKALGVKLRQAREAAKLTQSEVAAKASVHVNFYARVERGEENPSYEKLQSIMKVLKIKSLDVY
ncbi:MAG: helix-turn-helix domain-containing protein [Candidatus Saccharimonadales bacterium]